MSTILTFLVVGGALAAAAAFVLAEADQGATGADQTDATPATTRLLDWFRRTGATIGAALAGFATWLWDRRPRRRQHGAEPAEAEAAREPVRVAGRRGDELREPGGNGSEPIVAALGEPVGEVVPSARPTWGQRAQSFVGLLVLIALLGVGTALVIGVLIAALGDVLDGVVT